MFVLWLIRAKCETNIHCILVMFYYHDQKFVCPGGELENPTDRDQWSQVFLNNSKNYFATDRKPKEILSEKQNPKKYPQNTIYFAKVKHDIDNNGDPWLLKHLVNKTGPKKNTVENMKHFKIQLLFNSPKKYSSCDQYPKKYRLLKFKTPKNTPLIPWFVWCMAICSQLHKATKVCRKARKDLGWK